MKLYLDFAAQHWFLSLALAWFALIGLSHISSLLKIFMQQPFKFYDRYLIERQFAEMRDLRAALTSEFGIQKMAELVAKYPALSRGYDRWHDHCTKSANKPDIKLVA
jgi:hypothetical protein